MDGGSWLHTGDREQDHPKEMTWKKAKWVSEEALQTAVKRREAKSKGEICMQVRKQQLELDMEKQTGSK